MISIEIARNSSGQIHAFAARNHGSSNVCAAVSLLVLNTVNSIEALTDQPFDCEYKEDGGFIRFALCGESGTASALLLNTMALGLWSVQSQYGDEITIQETITEASQAGKE